MKLSDPGPGPRTAQGGDPEAGPLCGPVPEGLRAVVDEAGLFRDFLRGLRGMLAAAFVFLPLLNAGTGVIPLGSLDSGGGFQLIPAGAVTATATLSTLAAVTAVFIRRKRLPALARKASISGAAALAALTGYLTLYPLGRNAFDIWGTAGGHPVHLALEIPLAALYAFFFILAARAFALFGLLDYYRRYPSRDAAAGVRAAPDEDAAARKRE